MRALFRTLIALAYFVSATLAQAGFVINSYTGGGGGAAAASITFLQCTRLAVQANPATWTAENVGTASADRYTLVGVLLADGNSTFTISSMTIGGDSATELVDQGGTQQVSAGFYLLGNPSGTAEDIVMTTSEAMTYRGFICVWQVNNLSSSTPVATASGSSVNGAAISLDMNTTTDGVAAGVCIHFDSDAGITAAWTGLTERWDDPTGINNTAADLTVAGGSTPLTVSCDYSATANSSAAAAVSLR